MSGKGPALCLRFFSQIVEGNICSVFFRDNKRLIYEKMKIHAAFVGLTKRVKSGVSSCRGFRATAGPRTNCSFDGCCGLPQRDRSQREKRASFLFILLQHIYYD